MSAIVHAQYAFIHVIALDLAMLKGEDDPERQNHILTLLDRNVPRMAVGHPNSTLTDHMKLDEAVGAFMGAFMQWSAEAITAGQTILQEHAARDGNPSRSPSCIASP